MVRAISLYPAMEDRKQVLFSSILCVFLLLLGTSSAYDVVQTCQIVPNNTYIADPTSCAAWALCIEGKPYYGQCSNGLLYSSTQAICNWADDVTCDTANLTSMCNGLNGVYRANPTSCQSYCYCENGVSACTLCPTGQVYNPTTTTCVWSSTYACSVNSPCTLVPNNVFVQDITNCAGYYQCRNGGAIAGSCVSGYLYNGIDGTCDYPENVVCPSGSADSSNTGSTHPVGTATTCASLTSGQEYVSDGGTCRGYFYCANGASTTAPVWGACPTGSHFSQSLQECVDPYEVACPYNRCEGVSYTFVTAINSNCKSYDVCSNGVAKSESSCPSTYPYFNEQDQICSQTEPTFTVCSS